MKYIKMVSLLLSVTLLVASLCACAQTSKTTVSFSPSSQAESQNASSSEPTSLVDTASTDPAASTSDDLYDFQVTVNGTAYKLPVPFSEFAENGWEGEDFETSSLEPNQMTLELVKNGEMQIYIKLVNTSGDILPYSKCNVGGVTLDRTDAQKGAKLIMAKRITLGSTYDQIIAAYGSPSETNDSDSTQTLKYKSDTYSSTEFYIDKETKTLKEIQVENLLPSEKSSSSSQTANTDVPDAVKKYKAPTSLSSDLFSFQVKYGGALYQLPAPVAEFVKNGWKIQSNADDTVAAQRSQVGVELRKDNQVLRTTVKNYSDKAAPVKNCFVTDVIYDANGTVVPIELPKGITEQSTFEQIKSAYGEPSKVEDSSLSTYYVYGEIWQQVEINVLKDTKKITNIAVQYSPKALK